jgi:hypothetical protein
MKTPLLDGIDKASAAPGSYVIPAVAGSVLGMQEEDLAKSLLTSGALGALLHASGDQIIPRSKKDIPRILALLGTGALKGGLMGGFGHTMATSALRQAKERKA